MLLQLTQVWLKLIVYSKQFQGITMKTPEASFLTWQLKFHNENDCVKYLKKMRWPNGFICPHCLHDKGSELHCR